MNLILGAGLSGLSCSYHLGHKKCLLLEAGTGPYGHIGSERRDGFTWDQGPHVSFTKSDYVRELFAESVANEYEEYTVRTRNYFQGHWIDHPAQSNLYQIPEPLRSKCLEDFRTARQEKAPERFTNYDQWLKYAFGNTFAETFPSAYTRKYWTVEPRELDTDWIGQRIFLPTMQDVEKGYLGALERETHYISKVRYPKKGGYQSFAAKLKEGSKILLGMKVIRIDPHKKRVWAQSKTDGVVHEYNYKKLISTIPLPIFVKLIKSFPKDVYEASDQLSCSKLLLVNITAPHETTVDGNWFYIYDESMNSTRIHFTERLARNNAPSNHTGIQVEVYANPQKGFVDSYDNIARKVVWECVKMGFINQRLLKRQNENSILSELPGVSFNTKICNYANVIFNLERRTCLDRILNALEQYGLTRSTQDLDPFTKYDLEENDVKSSVVLAGRFAQWKYLWSDDCVLRGKSIANKSVI